MLPAEAALLMLEVSAGFDRLCEFEYRVDGREKVSGRAQFSADFAMDGMLWAAFLAAPLAHANIVAIDVSAALAIPGVRAVLTGKEIGERHLGRILFDWPVLAFEKVRFIGDAVAAVAADTPELAQAALAAIDVRYEELPPIFDPETAITSTTLVHESRERYTDLLRERPKMPHPNMQGYALVAQGDVAAGFARATRIFEHTFTTPRYHAGYVEPRATLVWIAPDGKLHVRTTNKSPFDLRRQLSITTGLDLEAIVIEPTYIGGDFGAKGLSIEEFQCYYLARATGRPVKYVRNYADDLRSTVVRHTAKITVRSGVDAGGRFVALDARFLYDGGAYAAGKPIPSLIPGGKVKTPYVFENSRIELICAYTNTVPSGQVRDPAGLPVVFAIDSHVDMIAHELGIDPLAFRRRNAARDGTRDVDGMRYVEPRAIEVLDALHEAVNWDRPPPVGRGRGISLASRHVGGGKTGLILRLERDGTILVSSGVAEQGGGVQTLAGRVVAAVLDIDPGVIRIERGDTASVPSDPGAGGSRATHLVGRAAEDAARQLLAKLQSVGYPGVGWDRAIGAITRDGSVEITGTYDEAHRAGDPEWHNFCAYCIEVSVDRETGAVTVHDVVCVIDVGTIINPVAHRGQIDGGFAFGFGHALTEELVVEDGRILNLSLADYKLPTQMDMPPFRVIALSSNRGPGPFGAKMAGELNTSSVPAAIANAVAAACGVRITALPLAAERIFQSCATNAEAS